MHRKLFFIQIKHLARIKLLYSDVFIHCLRNIKLINLLQRYRFFQCVNNKNLRFSRKEYTLKIVACFIFVTLQYSRVSMKKINNQKNVATFIEIFRCCFFFIYFCLQNKKNVNFSSCQFA